MTSPLILTLSPLLRGEGRGNWGRIRLPLVTNHSSAVVGQHPEAGVLQGDDARRAPFVANFILKEDLDRFVEVICVN